METLGSVQDTTQESQDLTDFEDLVALVNVADALSKAAQAIAEAAEAVSAASYALNDLDGLNAEAAFLSGKAPQDCQMDSHAEEMPEAPPEIGSGEGNQASEYGGDGAQNNTAAAHSPVMSVISISSDSDGVEPTHESNNKYDIEVIPLLSEFESPDRVVYDLNPTSQLRVSVITDQPESYLPAEPHKASEEIYLSQGIRSKQFGVGPNLQTESFDLKKLVEAHPKFPLGSNYIQLDRASDETPLAAYLALQSNKTIFIIRKRAGSQLSYYAKLLEGITKFSVFYPEEIGGYNSIPVTLQAFALAPSPAILLLAHDALHSVLLKSASPDCVVHWGVPLDIANYALQISSIQRRQPVRSCLIFPREQDAWNRIIRQWHLADSRIVQYPPTVLQSCFGPASPFQMVCRISTQVLAAMNTTPKPINHRDVDEGSSRALLTLLNAPPLKEPPSSSGRTPVSGVGVPSAPSTLPRVQASKPPPPSDVSLPQGQYYVVLDEPLDAVPLTSYLAVRSTRTVCFLPAKGLWKAYQQVFNRLTGIPTVVHDETNPTRLKKSLKAFSSQASGLLLRPAHNWETCFSKSLADCAIYWGLPTNRTQCLRKVTHSYLILTKSDYSRLSAQSHHFRQHPSAGHFNDGRKGSVLHELRSKTGAILAIMPNSPVSPDEYYAFLARRNGTESATIQVPSEQSNAPIISQTEPRAISRSGAIKGSSGYFPRGR